MVSVASQGRLWTQSLSEQLRTSIRDSGLSCYEIAKQAGTTPAVVARFLKGERDLRLATVDRLATVLNLELTQRKNETPA
jgi:predicted transcriptional regulator